MNKKTILYTGGFEHDTFEKNMQIFVGVLKADGCFEPMGFVQEHYNFGYICAGPDGRNIYGVDARLNRGSLVSYRVEADGKLRHMGELALPGAKLGLHCCVSRDGRYVLVACGDSSNVYVCQTDEQGRACKVTDEYRLPPGKGTLPRQMKGPAPHQACFDQSGKYVFLPDIHADRVLVMDFKEGCLKLNSSISVPPGDGPRHCVVDASNRFVYLLTEMGNTVITFSFDEGKLQMINRLNLVPTDYRTAHSDIEIQSGAIQLSPDGRYLFISMRNYFMPDGTDRLMRMKIGMDGLPGDPVSFSCGGVCPRSFVFSADARYILSGNKFSNEIRCMHYDAQTGEIGEATDCLYAQENAAIAVLW